MRPGARLLIVCLLLSSGFVQVPTYSAGPAVIPAQVATLPADMGEVSDLTCPTATLCVALSFTPEEGSGIAVGTGKRDAWTVTPLPHPSGETVQLAGLACSSASLCYAWGSAGAATVWVSTAPTSGTWQRQVLGAYPGPGFVHEVSCPGPALCVAVSDDWVAGQPLGGTAWVTQDPVGGSWSGTPLDSVYRTFNLDCVDVMCVVAGQSRTTFVEASVWSTPDVRAGPWTRTEPTVPFNDIDGLRRVNCVATSLCVIGALAVSGDGGTIYLNPGYFTSTAPTTGVWDWHPVHAHPYALGPVFCQAVGQCLVNDLAGISVETDPTDDVPPTLVGLQHQYDLNLRGLFCVDASTCLAWGSDSGGASAGPLMTTRVWRGPSSGGNWSGTSLPLPAGDTTNVPVANTLACAGLTCTAVGVIIDPSNNPGVVVGPVVWTAGADGVWHLVASGSGDGSGGGGGGSTATKVTTKVTLAIKTSSSRIRLAGKVKALHGCQKARRVKVLRKDGRTAAIVKSARDGRYSVRLTPKLRNKLGAKTRVKVTARWRGTEIRCLADRSPRVRVPD